MRKEENVTQQRPQSILNLGTIDSLYLLICQGLQYLNIGLATLNGRHWNPRPSVQTTGSEERFMGWLGGKIATSP